jgi:hypothetical protein
VMPSQRYFGMTRSAETGTPSYTITSCGLYCKQITILNDVSRVIRMMLHVVASPMIVILMTIEAPMIIILMILDNFIVQASFTIITYDGQNILMVQATGGIHH